MHNFNHLYYFFIIAKLKSVTSAARFLNTSQPSLSSQIKTLEMNLKRKLFIKKGRYLELTTEGQKVFTYCQKMFGIYEDLNNFLNSKEQNTEIKIGFSNEIARPFIANIVGEVLKKIPSTSRPNVKLNCVTHEVLIERLKTKKVDFILTNTDPHDFDLKIIKHFEFPVVLAGTNAATIEHELKNIKRPDLIIKKISTHLALPSEHLKLRHEFNAFMHSKKINYQSLIESDNLTTVIKVTLDGLTFCLLPKPYIYKELQLNQLKILLPANSLWVHKLYLVSRSEMSKSPFIKKLITEIDSLTYDITMLN